MQALQDRVVLRGAFCERFLVTLAEQFGMRFQSSKAKLEIGVPIGGAELTDEQGGVVQGLSLRGASAKINDG
jgi:hypothetical protein